MRTKGIFAESNSAQEIISFKTVLGGNFTRSGREGSNTSLNGAIVASGQKYVAPCEEDLS